MSPGAGGAWKPKPPAAPAPVAEHVYIRNTKTGFFGVFEFVDRGKNKEDGHRANSGQR